MKVFKKFGFSANAGLLAAAILSLVAASFSLAGAAFVPAMVLGIFWKRTTGVAAVCGMLSGLCMTLYYMIIHSALVRAILGEHAPALWFDIAPISAGVFGVPMGVLTVIAVSLVMPEPQIPQNSI